MVKGNKNAINQSKYPVSFSQRKVSRGPIENRAIRSAFNRIGYQFAGFIEHYLEEYQEIQLNSDQPVSLSKLEIALKEIIGSATVVVMETVDSELRRLQRIV